MNVAQLRGLYEARSYDEAIRLYRTDVASQDAEWHLYGALAYNKKGEFFVSLQAIDRACFQNARESVRAKVFFHRGTLKRLIGDLRMAVEDFTYTLKLLAVAKELRPLLLGATYYNLALTQEYIRDSSTPALENYGLALDEFRKEGMVEYERMTLQNMVWVLCERRDTEQAERLWGEANALCTSEDAKWRQRMLEAKIHLAKGETSEAMRLCEWIESGEGVSFDVKCLNLCTAVEAAISLLLFEQALLLANVAMTYTGKTELDSRCFVTANRAYTKALNAKMRAGA